MPRHGEDCGGSGGGGSGDQAFRDGRVELEITAKNPNGDVADHST